MTVNGLSTTSGVGDRPRRTVLATRPLRAWRTVDLLTVAFLGVAFGVAFWGWGLAYEAPARVLSSGFPPLGGLLSGPWLMAGVVGGLVIRRPGAALFCELLAAVVEMLVGSQWGVETLVSGIAQGLGAEIGFAVLAYRSFGPLAAVVAGALAAPLEVFYEWAVYYPDWSFGWRLAYLPVVMLSGAVVAGLGGWLVTSALARAGALGACPPGQEAREARAT